MNIEALIVMILGVLAKAAPKVIQAFVGPERSLREALTDARAAIPAPSSPAARADYDAALEEIRRATPGPSATDLEHLASEEGPVASAHALLEGRGTLARLAHRAKLTSHERELVLHSVRLAEALAPPIAKNDAPDRDRDPKPAKARDALEAAEALDSAAANAVQSLVGQLGGGSREPKPTKSKDAKTKDAKAQKGTKAS